MAVRHKRARDGRRLKLYQWASGLGMTRSTRELAHRMQRTPGGDLTKGPERAATSAHQLGDAWLRARTVVPDGSAPARRSPRPRLPAPPRAGDGNRAPKDMLVRVSGTLVPSCVWGIAMDGSSKGRAISRSPDRHGGHCNLGRRDEAGEWRRLPACWAAKREPRASFAEAHRDALGFLPRPISARTSPRSAPVPLALCCLLPGGPMPRPEISLFSFSLHRSFHSLKFLVMVSSLVLYSHGFSQDFFASLTP